jgi:ABC-type Fe3+/spermidine/putrescine transport system ATPase subunit
MRASVRTPYVELDLHAEPGEVVALIGPNGAGKTTALRALAGLSEGSTSLTVDGREVGGLPAHRRGVGWVPQSTALFGHLTALDNAAFALRSRGVRRTPARQQARTWLERLGVADLADARVGTLSGGQAARVALARALAGEPVLLLLDEPLAALDARTRDEVRQLLRSTLAGGRAAVVLVSHDPVDVLALADRVVVVEAGRVVQEGTPAEVAAAPRSSWVAALLGQNAWRGTTDSTGLRLPDGHVTAAEPLPVGLAALALCEPSSVTLHREPPSGSARTVLSGPVQELRALGGRVRVTVASTPPVVAEITAAAAAGLALAEGGTVWAAVKATEIRLVPLEPTD